MKSSFKHESQHKSKGLANFILFIMLTCNLFAQEIESSPLTDLSSSNLNVNNSINMCPGGIIFGIYSFNFEHLFVERHGVVVRLDFESVSESFSDDKIDANGYGIILNYRYHFSGALESMFLGSFARYRVYKGTGNTAAEEFDFTLPEFTFGLNAGKRWVWNSGFNITLAFGYGFANNSKETEPDNVSYKNTLNKFENEYDFLGPFYGEFSLGYAF
jgi:Protein of unknown function (DUF3575)